MMEMIRQHYAPWRWFNRARGLFLAGFFVIMATLVAGQPAWAETCRTIAGQQICIVTIQRSAKHYWEYRAVIRIDGVTYPLERYNCRDRTKTQPDGTIVPFASEGAGRLICQLLRQSF